MGSVRRTASWRISRTESAGRSSASKNSQTPSFVVRPDMDVKMSEILDVINAVRVSPKTDMRIEADPGLAIFIPKKLDPKGPPPRPNPLTLIVSIDDESNILLNGEQHGSLSNPASLERILKQIFKDRENNGVWRQGTNTTEMTVVIKLQRNLIFTDLVKVASAVKRAGSDNIGLQVDEPEKFASLTDRE